MVGSEGFTRLSTPYAFKSGSSNEVRHDRHDRCKRCPNTARSPDRDQIESIRLLVLVGSEAMCVVYMYMLKADWLWG